MALHSRFRSRLFRLDETIYPNVVKVEDAADAPAAGSPLRYDKALRVRLSRLGRMPNP